MVSLWDRIKSLLGFETEPEWKRKPELYYWCPNCEGIAVNAKWRMRDHKTDEVLFEHRGIKEYHREVQQQCPRCKEWIPMDDVHSLDEVAAFEQKAST